MNPYSKQALIVGSGYVLDLNPPLRFDDEVFNPLSEEYSEFLWLAVYGVEE